MRIKDVILFKSLLCITIVTIVTIVTIIIIKVEYEQNYFR